MYDVRVTRSYKEGDQWRDSYSFGYDDLMNVAKLLADAHSYITALRESEPGVTHGYKRYDRDSRPAL